MGNFSEMELVQKNEKPLKKVLACDTCGKTYVRKDMLAKHMEDHHKSNPVGFNPPESSTQLLDTQDSQGLLGTQDGEEGFDETTFIAEQDYLEDYETYEDEEEDTPLEELSKVYTEEEEEEDQGMDISEISKTVTSTPSGTGAQSKPGSTKSKTFCKN